MNNLQLTRGMRGFSSMHCALYYREQAERARRLAQQRPSDPEKILLDTIAQDLDDIAVDLERGAIEIRHPDPMPQR